MKIKIKNSVGSGMGFSAETMLTNPREDGSRGRSPHRPTILRAGLKSIPRRQFAIADCQSAIQQAASLRYAANCRKWLIFRVFRMREHLRLVGGPTQPRSVIWVARSKWAFPRAWVSLMLG
jgi:hypothetical protein